MAAAHLIHAATASIGVLALIEIHLRILLKVLLLPSEVGIGDRRQALLSSVLPYHLLRSIHASRCVHESWRLSSHVLMDSLLVEVEAASGSQLRVVDRSRWVIWIQQGVLIANDCICWRANQILLT